MRCTIGPIQLELPYCGVGYSDPCGDYSGPPTNFTFTRLDADLA